MNLCILNNDDTMAICSHLIYGSFNLYEAGMGWKIEKYMHELFGSENWIFVKSKIISYLRSEK